MDRELTARNRLQIEEAMPNHSFCVLFAGVAPFRSKDQQYPFSVNRNFYYTTGIDRELFILLITKQNGKTVQTLFIERPDELAEKWTGIRLRPEGAKEVSGISQVLFLDTFLNHLNKELLGGSYQFLYMDLEQPSADALPSKAHQFSIDMRAKHPYLEIRNLHPLFAKLRSIKEGYEIEQIQKAIAITKDGISNLMKRAEPGKMEYELEAEFDRCLKSQGVKEYAFNTIMAAGKQATILHYVENDHRINEGELVLADLGAAWNYYSADITRTFPVSGKFTDRQKTLYEIVLKVQSETIAAIRPGVTFAELNKLAKSVFAKELKAIGLITTDEEVANYYYHSIGHSLGLDTHDLNDNAIPLQPGFVLTVEPGLYIAEESIGIRIEDDILVTENGCVNLSLCIIKTVDEIESFMAANRS